MEELRQTLAKTTEDPGRNPTHSAFKSEAAPVLVPQIGGRSK